MSKFCSYCGRPLGDNEVCNCRQNAAPAQPTQQPVQPQAQAANNSVQVEKAKAVANSYFGFVKEYIKAPFATTAKAMSQKNITAAIITAVLYWICVAIFMFAALSKATSFIGGFGGIDISVPFFSTVLYALLMAAVILAASIVLFFAVLKIFKINVNFIQTVIAVAVNAILPAACVLLSFICIYISIKLMLAFLILGVVVWAMLGIAMVMKLFGVADSALSISACALAFLIAFVLSFWINSKFALKAVGKVEIEGEAIEKYIGDLSDMDIMDVIEEFM